MTEWTPEEAFCAIGCLAVETDGSVGREEMDALMDQLRESRIIPTDGTVDDLLRSVHHRLQSSTDDDVLDAAAAHLPEDWREPAFQLASNLIWSDDGSGPDEDRFLQRAGNALGIPSERRDAFRP